MPKNKRAQRAPYKALGSRLQYGFFALLIRCRGVFLAKLLLAFVVAWYCCVPSLRRRAYPYVSRRFPNDGRLRRSQRIYCLYWHLGKTLLARMIAGITGDFPVNQSASALQRIIEASPERGLIILSAHFGGWQLGLSGLEQFEKPVHIVQWGSPGEKDRHYFERGQGKAFNIIDASDPTSALVAAAAALRRGEIVCNMGDRLGGEDAQAKSLSVPFLGDMAHFPMAPYALASMTGARLVCVFTAWEGSKISLVQAVPLDIPGGLSHRRPDDFRPYVETYVKCLNQAVQAYPNQFYNFYNMWQQ